MKFLKNILFLGIILLISCNSQKVNYYSLKTCSDSKLNTITYKEGNNKIDFIKVIEDIENVFLENSLLKSKSKQSYIDFISKEEYLKINNSKIDNILEKYNIHTFESVNDLVFNCYRNQLKTYKKNSFLEIEIDIFEKYYSIGEENSKESLLELLDNIDDDKFKELYFRAPIIMLINNNINGIQPVERR